MAQQATFPASRSNPERRQPHADARHARSDARGRARHASRRDDGFRRLLAWTAAGAVVPGLGFLVAGRRRLGGALLGLVVVVLLGLVALVATGRLVDLGLRLAVRPGALLFLSATLVVTGLLWALVVVAGHVLLRRRWRLRLSTGQRLLAGALVAALVAAIAVPGATAVQYAMTQRSLVLSVFDEPTTPREAGLAAPDAEAVDPWEGTPRINVLLLGSDAGADREGTRPDTLITASIDTSTGETVLFSLPRNLEGVPFPAGTPGAEQFPDGFYPSGPGCARSECLLNAVWTWAEANPGLFPGVEEPGLLATRQAVGQTLGLPIDYYALVNLEGFTDVVDAMGGVELNIPRDYPIGGLDADGNQVEPSGYIRAGTRTLGGAEALAYARSRSDSTDYDRMGRQRCVIAAAVDQADPVTLARAFPQLAATAQRNVETDIPASELDAFVQLGLRVQKAELRSLPFTSAVIDSADPDFAAIRALVQEAVDPAPVGTPDAGQGRGATPSVAPPADGTATPPPADPEAAVDTSAVC